MSCYSFDDYEVTISFKTKAHGHLSHTFEVMAYSPQEADDLAFAQWCKLNYEHIGVLTYETNLIE